MDCIKEIVNEMLDVENQECCVNGEEVYNGKKNPASVIFDETISTVNELFDSHKRLVYYIVNARIPYGTGLYEDSIQVGMIALWKASLEYDETAGCKFSVYAYTGILNEVSNLYQKYYGRKGSNRRKMEFNKVYLDAIAIGDGESANAPRDHYNILVQENFIDDYIENMSIIGDLTRLMKLYIPESDSTPLLIHAKTGMNQREIAEIMNVAPPTISRRIGRTCKKLKAMYEVGKENENKMHDICIKVLDNSNGNISSNNTRHMIYTEIEKRFDVPKFVLIAFVNKWVSDYKESIK